MILSFSVENYRSFRSEQTFNLIASKRLGVEDPTQCVTVSDTDEAVLRVSSIYGANGAGKSNLVSALRFVEKLVLKGSRPGKRIPRVPFAFEKSMIDKPSCFEIRYLSDGVVFGYGFACDSTRVYEEWLDVYEGKKARSIFTRVTDANDATTVKLGAAGKDGCSAKLKALTEVGARSNQLFFTEIVNLDDPDAQGERLVRAIKWFANTLHIIPADAEFAMLAEVMAEDNRFADFAGRFLKEASTGIDSLEVQIQEVPLSKISNLPSRFVEEIIPKLEEGETAYLPGPDGFGLFIEGAKKEVVKIRRIAAVHQNRSGEPFQLPLGEESDGSRRLLNLLPSLHQLQSECGVYVIDELERSMHPVLARKFIEYFLKAVKTPSCQLIFTTHASTLLDLDLLRRDGVWFVEKNSESETHLYALSDFKVRNDYRIDKAYLQGRFGAIPFLAGVDRLIDRDANGSGES